MTRLACDILLTHCRKAIYRLGPKAHDPTRRRRRRRRRSTRPRPLEGPSQECRRRQQAQMVQRPRPRPPSRRCPTEPRLENFQAGGPGGRLQGSGGVHRGDSTRLRQGRSSALQVNLRRCPGPVLTVPHRPHQSRQTGARLRPPRFARRPASNEA
jgi:hypothetical protein